jgi:hypothetical protein
MISSPFSLTTSFLFLQTNNWPIKLAKLAHCTGAVTDLALWIFTLQTNFAEWIMSVKQGMVINCWLF